jgi:hypothetical protein
MSVSLPLVPTYVRVGSVCPGHVVLGDEPVEGHRYVQENHLVLDVSEASIHRLRGAGQGLDRQGPAYSRRVAANNGGTRAAVTPTSCRETSKTRVVYARRS